MMTLQDLEEVIVSAPYPEYIRMSEFLSGDTDKITYNGREAYILPYTSKGVKEDCTVIGDVIDIQGRKFVLAVVYEESKPIGVEIPFDRIEYKDN